MSKQWKFKPCDDALAEQFFQALEKIPKPLAALLAQRGCKTADEAERFINPALSTLRDPFEMPDMDKAAARDRRAISRKAKVSALAAMSVGVGFTCFTIGWPWVMVSIAVLVISGSWIWTRAE